MPSDFCVVGLGAGAHGRMYHPIMDGWALQLEVLTDLHVGLSNESPSERAQLAVYGAAGGHWIKRNDGHVYGLFAGVTGTSHMGEE
ncbi:MAG: hypothetical protein ACTSP2_07600, partial [Alphaproteobacteria bacterium]